MVGSRVRTEAHTDDDDNDKDPAAKTSVSHGEFH